MHEGLFYCPDLKKRKDEQLPQPAPAKGSAAESNCSLLAKENSSKFSLTVMKKSFILFPAGSFFLLLFFSYTDLHIKEYFFQGCLF